MNIVTIIGLIAAIITILGAVTKKGRSIFKKFWDLISRYRPKIPKQTLRIIQQEDRSCWSLGKSKGKPAMQISGHFFVTNISTVNVLICKVVMQKMKINGEILVRHPEGNVYGSYEIPANRTTEASVNFSIQPPICKEEEIFIENIIFFDQFSNPHRVYKAKFCPSSKKKMGESPSLEEISKITNPVEREVVGILQAELSRYNSCGRRVGGLGSIINNYKGQSFKGVGTVHSNSESPEQQDIVQDPEKARIESDNANVLIDYFSTLDDKKKDDFINILLSRLSRDGPYAPIGYFILFVLYNIDHLNEALNTAKIHLQGDSAYGFSDLLILLSGLLRYEHPRFSNDMLDDIEQFLEGIKEFTFRIREKLLVIRAFRLAGRIKGKKEIKEKGIWDYVYLNDKSLQDLKDCALRITNATKEISEKMRRRTQEAEKIKRSSVPGTAKKMYKLTKNTAIDMNSYAKQIEEDQPKLHSAWNDFIENSSGFIQIACIKTKEDKEAFIRYSDTIKGLKEVNNKCLEGLREYRMVFKDLKGISSDITQASNRIISVLDLLIDDFQSADSYCSKVLLLLDEKIESEENR
ncbi:MAG: hypothetical protein ACTSWX_16030 [Promethearchaeota archaeon]